MVRFFLFFGGGACGHCYNNSCLIERAVQLSDAGDFRLACHLADLAGWAAPDDAGVHAERALVYRARRAAESSLMAKGIYAGAARESEAIAG